MNEKLKKYGKSEKGSFEIVDTIGVPHPYCIGAKHVAWAADHFSGMLGEEAIKDAEANGIYCDICRSNNRRNYTPILKVDQHKQALLVACYKPIEGNKEELQAFLLKCKPICEADKYEGFSFLKKF